MNELGLPLDVLDHWLAISATTRQAIELLGQRQAEAVLADKGYDSDAVVAHVETAMIR